LIRYLSLLSNRFVCVFAFEYVAVSSLVFGQGLLFGSVQVLRYGVAVGLGFGLFMLLYEEPRLSAKFGSEYDSYCKQVRRVVTSDEGVERF
jgi:protein-S-isoprenylcysteine O-methyltransferase Ste14